MESILTHEFTKPEMTMAEIWHFKLSGDIREAVIGSTDRCVFFFSTDKFHDSNLEFIEL